MKKLQIFLSYDSQLILPLDPYKPLPEALKEGLRETTSPQKRLRYAVVLGGAILALVGVGILVSVVIVLFR
jgi:hypothetical protein